MNILIWSFPRNDFVETDREKNRNGCRLAHHNKQQQHRIYLAIDTMTVTDKFVTAYTSEKTRIYKAHPPDPPHYERFDHFFIRTTTCFDVLLCAKRVHKLVQKVQ
jgi:hypothetical protein